MFDDNGFYDATETITIIIYMCRFIYMPFRLYLYWWLLS